MEAFTRVIKYIFLKMSRIVVVEEMRPLLVVVEKGVALSEPAPL